MKENQSISHTSPTSISYSPSLQKPQSSSRLGKRIAVLGAVFILILLAVELILRNVYGFTDAILFRGDDKFEYIAIPQKRYRFMKNDFYNSFSQRNREITTHDSSVVLGFGDSVINGGTQTDQDSLATTRLTNYLSKKYNHPVLFTNISAGSWGPDNCYAYLKKYGNFGAKKILLVVSSHDAYDNMNFEKVVGILPNYPDEQYPLAIAEAVDRYIYPRFKQKFFSKQKNKPVIKNESFQSDSLLVNKYRPGLEFNSGFKNFKKYCDSTGISLVVYLHAEKQELTKHAYNEQGKEIIRFCEANKIFLIKELDYNFTEADYRDDDFHLSEQGQRQMFNVLKKYY